MRKRIFTSCVALAAGLGLVIGALNGGLGLTVLLGLKFTVIGMAIGAFLSRVCWKSEPPEQEMGEQDIADQEEWERLTRIGSHDTSPEELTENSWRDKGHPPLSHPDNYDPHK
ncbi:hypothetical protein [Xanthomonas arboricola]|uniref:hypothetical protein n=1 Tax=Xanthomonas arboricola TaxID=56448 RepID=UPI0011B0D1B7|nr:hypothetical protein [Xanthomonas arboricola]